MSRTVSFNVSRSIYTQRKSELHQLHVLSDSWMLEDCEYCLTEYYMEIPPLGAD